MDNPSPEIMTIEDVAAFLRIPLSSVYRLAHAGKIPGQKIGRHWRFRRQTLERWMDRHPLVETIAQPDAVSPSEHT